MKVHLLTILFAVSSFASAAHANCDLAQLQGSFVEAYSQSESLTEADFNREGSLSKRLWRFGKGKASLVERFLDSKTCALDDTSCTYYQILIDYDFTLDPSQCSLTLSATSRMRTLFREFGQPYLSGIEADEDRREYVSFYQPAEKQTFFTLETKADRVMLKVDARETLLMRR